MEDGRLGVKNEMFLRKTHFKYKLSTTFSSEAVFVGDVADFDELAFRTRVAIFASLDLS